MFLIVLRTIFVVLLIIFCIEGGMYIVLVQKSLSGDNFTLPTYSITWNGLTFSTRVASGCSNQPIESYFKVTTFPVF